MNPQLDKPEVHQSPKCFRDIALTPKRSVKRYHTIASWVAP